MPLIVLSCAWLAGIFLGYRFDLPPLLALSGVVPLFLLFLSGRKRPVILCSLALIIIFAAAAYSYAALNTFNERDLRFYNDMGAAEVRGVIASDPDIRDRVTHVMLAAREIRLEDGWREIDGAALLYVPRYPELRYGDLLQVSGFPETPPEFEDFDYRGYLSHQGIYTTITYPHVEVLERGKGFTPLEWVYSLRGEMSRVLARVLPEPQGSLAQAIILGKRGMLPPALKSDFAQTGTAYLLAISGLHLGIVAGILLIAGTRLLGRRYHLHIWLALSVIWLYAIFTGMYPPVTRGAAMASMFLLAELLGRQRSAINALVFVAAVMVGFQPYILGDASFQLSFLAMAGLIFIFPYLRSLGRRMVGAGTDGDGTAAGLVVATTDALAVTFAAIIAVWPLVAYYFGIVSFSGPLATLLLLPALPVVIVTGILTALVGLGALPVAQVLGWLCWLFLLYMSSVVGGMAGTPFAFTEITVSPAFVLSYYSVIAAAILLAKHRGKLSDLITGGAGFKADPARTPNFLHKLPLKPVIMVLAVIALLVSVAAAAMPNDKLRVSFLDVGTGDAILIQKGNYQVLVDGGPSPQALALALGKLMPFWDRTIELFT